jgi:energy-coupling factor transport system permease protein
MMRALTYQVKHTAVHRLNPVVKLVWAGGLVVLSLLFAHPFYVMVLLLAIMVTVGLAGVWREWSSVLKLCLWLGAGIIAINALVSYQGAHVLAAAPFEVPVLGRPVITMEAIAFGAVMALKLLVIVSAFAFVNTTVHPDDIMLVQLKLKLPYKSVLVASLSTRFIPCLVEDVQRISDAYRTRGVSLDTGSWITRVKKRAGIIIPLLSNSLDRAVQVAEAMEARAFGAGRKRSFHKDIKLTRLDAVATIAALVPLIAGIILRVTQHGGYSFYPTLERIETGFTEWAMPAMLLILLLAVLPLAFLKRSVELD